MTDRRLAECKTVSGATDGAKLVDDLEDRQQVQIKAAQIEHGARGRSVIT
jgi:hypothetical protein